MRRVRPFRRGQAPSFRTPSGRRRNDVFVAKYTASALLVVAAVALSSCGGSKKAGAPTTAPATAPALPATTTAPQPAKAAAPSPLTPEAQSAATGDIPDNQVFLQFRNAAAGYAMKYPEGWAQQGSGRQVTFRDKNNIVRVIVSQVAPPTHASVKRDLSGVSGAHIASNPQTMTIRGGPAVKVVYTTQSAPNSVTGKRVTLAVDRYYVWRNGKVAVVDLGTPQGVDNVDAYRLMIESFHWR
jgi:hypothetical protein